MNKVTIIGNLGSDPEMRYTPSGQSVTQFSVATNRRYTAPDGERREETEWFRVNTYGRLADVANQYLTKGQQVYVEGRLRSSAYVGRDGQPRASLDVHASDIQFLGSRRDSDGDYGGGGDSYGSSSRAPAVSGGGGYDDVDDLPF